MSKIKINFSYKTVIVRRLCSMPCKKSKPLAHGFMKDSFNFFITQRIRAVQTTARVLIGSVFSELKIKKN